MLVPRSQCTQSFLHCQIPLEGDIVIAGMRFRGPIEIAVHVVNPCARAFFALYNNVAPHGAQRLLAYESDVASAQRAIAAAKDSLVRCRTSLFIRRDELMVIACWGNLSVARSEIIRNYWALIAESGYGEHEIYAHRLKCTLANQFRRVLRESEGSLGGITFKNRPFILQMFGEQIRKFQLRLEGVQQQYLIRARDILEDPHSKDEITTYLYWEMQYELQCNLSLFTQVEALLPIQADHYAHFVAAYDQQEGFAEYGQYSVERHFIECWEWRDLEGCVTAVTILRQFLTPPLARDYKNEFLNSDEITLSRPTLTHFERVLKLTHDIESHVIPFESKEAFYDAIFRVLVNQVRTFELFLEHGNEI